MEQGPRTPTPYPASPDRTITLARSAHIAASPDVDHHTIELNRNGARTAYLRRLTSEVRRPGFALLIAETTAPSGTTVLTGCAHGFPVRGDGPWWQGLDGYLPESLLRVAGAGRLFAVSGILVGRRVRTENQARDWNLARRLQKRLLTDHAAALGVMLVSSGDVETLEALRSWGWRYVPADARPRWSRGPWWTPGVSRRCPRTLPAGSWSSGDGC